MNSSHVIVGACCHLSLPLTYSICNAVREVDELNCVLGVLPVWEQGEDKTQRRLVGVSIVVPKVDMPQVLYHGARRFVFQSYGREKSVVSVEVDGGVAAACIPCARYFGGWGAQQNIGRKARRDGRKEFIT